MTHTFIRTGQFNARYGGRCSLDECERQQVIEIGDVVEYVDDEIYHLRCAGRLLRGEIEKPCNDCHLIHAGECE